VTVPHVIREFEERLEKRYTKADDKEYRDTESEGWYHCDHCGLKIYYSRRQPTELARHEDECAAGEGPPEFQDERREP